MLWRNKFLIWDVQTKKKNPLDDILKSITKAIQQYFKAVLSDFDYIFSELKKRETS